MIGKKRREEDRKEEREEKRRKQQSIHPIRLQHSNTHAQRHMGRIGLDWLLTELKNNWND
jgi:hypothetical protein